MQCFVWACKAIFRHGSYHTKNRLGSKPTHVHCWSLKYDVVSAAAGPDTDTYFELKMLCLFHFVLKSEIQA